ncbi:hypothetical protein ACLOJK_032577 [Asimina triloba]
MCKWKGRGEIRTRGSGVLKDEQSRGKVTRAVHGKLMNGRSNHACTDSSSGNSKKEDPNIRLLWPGGMANAQPVGTSKSHPCTWPCDYCQHGPSWVSGETGDPLSRWRDKPSSLSKDAKAKAIKGKTNNEREDARRHGPGTRKHTHPGMAQR